MAQTPDFKLPFQDLTKYIPENLQNSVNTGLVSNLLNRFMTHDESAKLFGYVGRKPSALDDKTARLPQVNPERDLNAVTPVFTFKNGTETVAFTAQELIAKARAIGIDQVGQSWLYTQANQYLPPINIDKFANYYNYFWIAKTLPTPPNTPWNTELLPEYYVIAKPLPTDNQKMNVVCATTTQIVRTGSGFEDQTFTVEFITPLQFKVTANTYLGYYVTTGAGSDGAQSITYDLAAMTTPTGTLTSAPTVETTFTFDVAGPAGVVTLMTFTIARAPVYDQDGLWADNEAFIAGDEFLIDTTFLSRTYTVSTVSVTPGIKGRIKGVLALNEYQTIDGITVSEGQRVLVKNNSAIENGIYIVKPQAWIRAEDYDGAQIAADAVVWIQSGTLNAGRLYESGAGNSWPDPNVPAIITDSNTNDWQEGNFWVHSSELNDLGLTRSQAIQATRPIIEFHSDLELNNYVTSTGVPSASTGVKFKQYKTEFNQIPLFNLYRYDGTHSGLVSSLFFYEEDLTADLDLELQKRVKLSTNSSSDFLFNHGMVDADGDLLFYKKNGVLKTIWHAGYDAATVVDQAFVGLVKGSITELIPTTSAIPQTWTLTALSTAGSPYATTFSVVGSVSGQLDDLTVGVEYSNEQMAIVVTLGTLQFLPGEQFVFSISAGPIVSAITWVGAVKGALTNIVPATHTQQQVWTLQAITPTTFQVTGSKTATITGNDVITVGVPYSNSEFSCLITAGTQPYDVDDYFLFRIGNFETPRYVYRDSNDKIYDLYGGELADTTGIGAYQTPRTLIHNPYNEAADEVTEGTLYSHFRSILQNQIADASQNYAFGGNIKNWSEQHTLLMSLLMQRDLTPISMIDLAQRQYENGLNAYAELYKTSILQYFATNGVVSMDGSASQDAKLNALLDALITKRSADADVRTILYDTTAGVAGIPATLPQLGVLPLVAPGIVFHNILNNTLLRHHDGHYTTLNFDTVAFRRAVLNETASITVTHYDGTTTPAVTINATAPSRPYRGSIWIVPGPDALMYAFDVQYDSQDEVDAKYTLATQIPIGTEVFRRDEGTAGILYVWDGVNWVAQSSFSSKWVRVDLADTLNHLMLAIEERLYLNVNPNARRVDFTAYESDTGFQAQLKRELYAYGVRNQADPAGSDYLAVDAFTWNYSQANIANFPPLDTATVPARWFDILKAHQRTVAGVIPTERPNLEPWKLLGYNDLSTWWATLTSAQQQSFLPYATPSQMADGTLHDIGQVRAIQTENVMTVLTGLQTIDGIALANGDRVLLQNEVAPENNGVWVVSSGNWTRASDALTLNGTVGVLQGSKWQNTVWALTNSPTIGTDPVLFEQVRLFSVALWEYVAQQRPTLRTSVDPTNDMLIAPYAAPSTYESQFALTTITPPGISGSYTFGQNSIVETIWKSSVDYGYGLARALFRHDPLYFLGFCWGFNWVEVDGILYDGYDLNTPGHKRFKLHGESVRTIDRTNAISFSAITGTSDVDVSITYSAYEVSGSNRYQNFTVKNNTTGLTIGYLREGVSGSISAPLGAVSCGSIFINDFGRPFHIGDTFRITANANGSNAVWTFTPAAAHKILGFGQTFTNALRAASIDTNDSYAIDAFRNYDVYMGHRVGALVSTDDLLVSTDSETLTTASYELLFKKNRYAADTWAQALRITVSQFGTGTNSTVFLPSNNMRAPGSDGSDWVFRIEGYNPRYSTLKYYQMNTSGPYETFNILDQSTTATVWKHYTQVASTVTTDLPIQITGIQNVLTFLFGYAQYLEDAGWVFNKDLNVNVDAETGRVRTWQLEAEKLVAAMYKGTDLDLGHVMNPFMDKIGLRQPYGLLSEFTDTSLFDVTADAAVFDVVGEKFRVDDLFVIRGNQMSEISAVAPMYSVHAQLDTFEHLFVFNRYIEDSTQTGTLYHPFSGSRVVTYKFNGRRQANVTFRPEYGGHYVVGHEVRQGLQASTDMLANVYNPNAVFENTLTSKHALALLGFSTKEYFDDLDITAKSQFNFWRGLIQSKGTNLSIGAYLNNNRFEDAKVDEYWAYKVATYGDARQHTFPELRLQVADTVQQFTQLQFDAQAGGELTNFTQITRYDEDRWFSIDDLDQDTYFKAEIVGTYDRSDATIGAVITLPFVADTLIGSGFTKVNATTVQATSTAVSITGYGPSTPKYNPVKLFNYAAAELVEEIPMWHPAMGQHTPIALESVNVISNQNPARYNYSTQVANNNSYDPLRPWGANEVGRVWFDTRNLAYIPYYDTTIFPDRAERLSRWGSLADYASIDVYEWVQSTVPPSEFNALAASQAGDADLSDETKASGEVAREEQYYRDRQWKSRAVLWSKLASPYSGDRGYVLSPDLKTTGPEVSIVSGFAYVNNPGETTSPTWADIGVSVGVGRDMRIGAVYLAGVPIRPVSEHQVVDMFTTMFSVDGGTTVDTEVEADPVAEVAGVYPAVTVSITAPLVPAEQHIALTGDLVFSAVDPNTTYTTTYDADGAPLGGEVSIQLRCRNALSGYEIVELGSYSGIVNTAPLFGVTLSLTAGDVIPVTFTQFGFSLSVTINSTGSYLATAVQEAIVAALNSGVVAYDAVRVTQVVGYIDPTNGTQSEEKNLSNALLADGTPGYDVGWAAWVVPTQAELDADGTYPVSTYRPYVGEYSSIELTYDQLQDAVNGTSDRTLNDGTSIGRYTSTWSDWNVLSNTVITDVQTTVGATSMVLTADTTIPADRTTVYVNGIAQLSAAYTIVDKTITLMPAPTFGSVTTAIIRHYEPSAKELAFDPDVEENLSYQRQYKSDYEYVSVPTRNTEGSLSSNVYYFWVKNKNTVAKGKSLSISSIAQNLRDGPANFLTFQNLLEPTSTLPYRYDAITISGLSYLVGKDDTFKLRFTRNFTLRDDPQDLDLKDTHTEWSLIRPGQRTKIPEALWQKLTDSVAGVDAAGNDVPSLRRVLYDERNDSNTQYGFGAEQTLAPRDLLVSSIIQTIVNTKLINTTVPADADGNYPSDFIEALNFDEQDSWFDTSVHARKTMTTIWTSAKPTQINEIFFAALDDILASNYELTDLFKTSRLAAYSIKVVPHNSAVSSYE